MTHLILAAFVASTVFTGAVSTTQLHRGCVERNPFAPSTPAWNAVVKAGTSTLIGVALHELGKHHSKLSRALSLTYIGVNVTVGVHDSRVRCS